MKIEISGDGLKLLEDFVYYGEVNEAEICSAMYYDELGFVKRLIALKNAVESAKMGGDTAQ